MRGVHVPFLFHGRVDDGSSDWPSWVILYAPDYVINVGGVMAILGLEIQGWTHEMAEKEVVGSVQRTLRRIFESATVDGITTEAAARKIAENHLYPASAQAPCT